MCCKEVEVCCKEVKVCSREVQDSCRKFGSWWEYVWGEQCGESGREDSLDREHPQEGGGQGAATQVRAGQGDMVEGGQILEIGGGKADKLNKVSAKNVGNQISKKLVDCEDQLRIVQIS